jgi:hypothetical protein
MWTYKMFTNKIEIKDSENTTYTIHKYYLFLLTEMNNEELMRQDKNLWVI